MAKPSTLGDLGPLTFGSMRLDRAGGPPAAARLLGLALDLGVRSFHVSQEYETWPLFAEAWRQAGCAARGAQLVAKLGVPHFGETAFDPPAFRNKIDAYRQALGIDRVAVVQWLLRYDLKDEAGRAAIFDRDAPRAAETVRALQDEGAIGSLVSFPYTRAIAQRALGQAWCDGLALYCNVLELEMADLFDAAAGQEKDVIAIRPFAAGRVFTEAGQTAEEAIALPLAHPATATVVASVSSPEHLRRALSAAQARPGRSVWDTAAGRLHV